MNDYPSIWGSLPRIAYLWFSLYAQEDSFLSIYFYIHPPTTPSSPLQPQGVNDRLYLVTYRTTDKCAVIDLYGKVSLARANRRDYDMDKN